MNQYMHQQRILRNSILKNKSSRLISILLIPESENMQDRDLAVGFKNNYFYKFQYRHTSYHVYGQIELETILAKYSAETISYLMRARLLSMALKRQVQQPRITMGSKISPLFLTTRGIRLSNIHPTTNSLRNPPHELYE